VYTDFCGAKVTEVSRFAINAKKWEREGVVLKGKPAPNYNEKKRERDQDGYTVNEKENRGEKSLNIVTVQLSIIQGEGGKGGDSGCVYNRVRIEKKGRLCVVGNECWT